MRICPRCSSVYAAHVARCGLDNELLVEAPHDPLLGKSIDRYQIIERLGTGGMGCVYRATHAIIDREYAIKVLYGDFASDEKFRTRFQREAQSISKIRHPNVVTVEDFGTSATGLTFLAMEMVRGRTLEELIEREAPLSPTRTAHLIRQVAAGLGAAHRLGFVHRDVKPANIMLTKVDGVEWVKILDFGAVNLRSVPLDQRLTSIGHIIGTPTYMAPEQTQDPNVAPTADLYALGVIMHEMLTGQPPFVGSGRAEVLVKHITEAPPPTPPSRGLEALTQKLLKKHPSDRPQTTDEVIQAIDRLNLGLQPVPIPSVPSNATMVPPPVSLSGMTQPLQVVEASKGTPIQRAAEPERTNFDTFPSLGVADPAEQEAWSGWAEASLDAASYADVASAEGPPRYPSLNLKMPSTEDSAPPPVDTDPTAIEPGTPAYMRDTTDPRFGMPEIRDSDEGPAPSGESTDVGIQSIPRKISAAPLKLHSDEGLLYEQPLADAPRPAPDDGGPTQVDFRVNFADLGLGTGTDDTVPLPKTLLPKAALPELQSFSDQPISPDEPLGSRRLEAPLRPRPDLDPDPEASGFETSRTVLDPALLEGGDSYAVRPVLEEAPGQATMRDTLLPNTRVPVIDQRTSGRQVIEQFVGVKTPPPLMPVEELPAVPHPVRPLSVRRLAIYAAVILALLVVIGVLGSAYLRSQTGGSNETAPQVSIQK